MKPIRKSSLALVAMVALLAHACNRESNPPAGGCATSGQGCVDGVACCSGFECDAGTGACVVPISCVAANGSCAGGEACCSGTLCLGETCTGCPGDSMCIASGSTCQFSEQCCGGTSCQPDGSGEFRCANCRPDGAECSGAGDTTCCGGMPCTWDGGSAVYRCLAPCGVGYGCCFAEGESCVSGTQCCTGVCGGGLCRTSTCAVIGGPCVANSDCCLGACQVPAGSPLGSCECPLDY